jgi:hypothetical protein
VATSGAPGAAVRDANARRANAAGASLGEYDRLYWNSKRFLLASPEGDDAANRIVRRHADGHAISGDNLDSEAAHPAAELGQHFVAGIALYSVEAPTVHGHDSALHIDEIVLAQIASGPFSFSSVLTSNIVPQDECVNLVIGSLNHLAH